MNVDAGIKKLLKSLTDGVSFEIMQDPYVANCRHTYDKSTWDQILASRNRTCPTCRAPVSLETIKPNFALRSVIESSQALISQFRNSEQLRQLLEEEQKQDGQAVQGGASHFVEDEVKYDPKLKVSEVGDYTVIQVENQDAKNAIQSDICLCIDVSGSMSTGVTVKNEKGEEEDHGLTRLDIVKHASKTIVMGMTRFQRLAIVSFHTDVKVQMEMSIMNDEGKENACRIIDDLSQQYQTNLWGGIMESLDLLRTSNANRNNKLVVLTDGVPTSTFDPAGTYVDELRKYNDKYPDFSYSVDTMGFGYQLDSQLLSEVSNYCNGNYSFIPDGTFVGTVFVNMTANTLVTSANSTTLKIHLKDKNDLRKVMMDPIDIDSCYQWVKIHNGFVVELANMTYGQNRCIVIPKVAIESVQLSFMDVREHSRVSKTWKPDNGLVEIDQEVFFAQYIRQRLASAVTKCLNFGRINQLENAKSLLQETIVSIKSFVGFIMPQSECSDIMKDLEGQISEAFSRQDWYDKWGKHYVSSLARAHMTAVCNNFKDPGVQHFGGALNKKLREEIETKFKDIPPPTPSARVRSQSTGYGRFGSYSPPSPVDMTSYYSSSGPCFRGDCLVTMRNGERKRVDEIRTGDLVMGYAGTYDSVHLPEQKEYRVRTVIKTACDENKARFVKIGNLVVTPWHPILVQDPVTQKEVWDFPYNVVDGDEFEEDCKYVYNFILGSGHIMEIGGISCVTLGHSFDDNDCISHEYFGSDRVVQDLSKFPGFENGLVVMENHTCVRDDVTGQVNGYLPENESSDEEEDEDEGDEDSEDESSEEDEKVKDDTDDESLGGINAIFCNIL